MQCFVVRTSVWYYRMITPVPLFVATYRYQPANEYRLNGIHQNLPVVSITFQGGTDKINDEHKLSYDVGKAVGVEDGKLANDNWSIAVALNQ